MIVIKQSNRRLLQVKFLKPIALSEKVKFMYFLRIAGFVGLIFTLNVNILIADQAKSSPKLTCLIPAQEQKESSVVSNIEQISLTVKLVKSGKKPFQGLSIPSNKKDFISMATGIERKMGKHLKQKQTVFIQIISASNKKEIPFTVITTGFGQSLNEETISLALEIPLDAKSKQAKVNEFFKRMDQKRFGDSAETSRMSPKDKYNQLKARDYLMNLFLENRIGIFSINCKYLSDQDDYWKGELNADPLIIEIKNKGSFWDRTNFKYKEPPIKELPFKPQPTKPKMVLNALGKELEQLAFRFPRPPGKPDLPKVTEGLADTESSTRLMALRVLIKIITHNETLKFQGHEKEVNLNKQPKILASLLIMVKDKNPKIRSGSITILSLGFEPSDKIQSAIYKQMQIESSREVKMSALNFIQKVGGIPEEYESILIDILNSKDKGLSRNAAITMGAIKMKSGLPLLIEKFKISNIEGSFETYYRAIYLYKKEAKPYLPVLESRMKEFDVLLEKINSKKDKRRVLFIKSGLQNVIDKIRNLKSDG